jgi:hypothetical protein
MTDMALTNAPERGDTLALRAVCLSAGILTAALGLVVVGARLSMLAPFVRGSALAVLAGMPGTWVAFLAPLLVALGSVLVFWLDRPSTGLLLTWLGGIVWWTLFLAGPAAGGALQTVWEVSLVTAAIACVSVLGCESRWQTADVPAWSRRATAELPLTMAAAAGTLAWLGGALLGVHIFSIDQGFRSSLFASDAMIWLALMTAGTGAIGVALHIRPPDVPGADSGVVIFRLTFGLLLIALLGDGLLQFSTAVSEPTSSSAPVYLLAALIVAVCAVGAVRVANTRILLQPQLLVRCLVWGLALTLAAAAYEVAVDLTGAQDFAGLWSAAVIVACVPYTVVAGIALTRAISNASKLPARSRSSSGS